MPRKKCSGPEKGLSPETLEGHLWLLEGLPEGVVVLDSDGKILFVNGVVERRSGLPRERIVGRSFLESFPFVDPEEAQRKLDALKRGEVQAFDGGYPDRDGSALKVEVTASPLFRDGAFVGSIVISRDVTARRLAERDLDASIRLFRDLADNAPVGVAVVQDYRIMYVNRAGADIVGCRVADVLAWKPKEYLAHIHPDDIPHVLEEMQRRQRGETAGSDRYMNRYIHPTKGVRHVEQTVSVISFGGATATLAIMNDVTERVENEAALKRSEEQFRVLSERSPNLVFLYDGERLLYVNQRTVDVTGYSREALMAPGFDYMQLIHPDSREAAAVNLTAFLDGEGRLATEYRILARDGSVREVLISSNHVDLSGRACVLGIATDVTDLRAVVREQAESEERYRSLFEMSVDPIFVHDLDGRIFDANQAALARFGYTKAEVPGLRISDLLPEEALEGSRKAFGRIAAEGVVRFEIEHVTKEGERFPTEVSATMLELGGIDVIHGTVHDLTARRKAEAALRRSEELYRTTVDAMTDPMHVVDRELNVLLFNRPLVEWTRGHGVEADLRGANLRSAFPFLPGKVWEEYRTVFDTGRTLITTETRVAGGREYTTRAIKVPMAGPDGTVERVLTVLHDLTGVVRADATLRLSEVRFRNLVDHLSDVIVEIDLDGRFTYVSPQAREVFGLDPEEVVGMSAFDFIHPDDVGLTVERMEEAMASGALVSAEYRTRNAAGDYVHVSARGRLVEEMGDPRYIGIVRDVGERRRAEEALVQSDQMYRNLVESASDVIFTLFPDGTFASLNRAFRETLGYAPDEWIGREFLPLVLEADRGGALELLSALMESGGPRTRELRFVTADGGVITGEVTATTVRRDDEVVAVLGIARDVTDRRMADLALRESLKEKEVLLKEVHHRVKNNMQIISSMLSLQSAYIEDMEQRDIFCESQNRVRSMALIHEKLYNSEDLSQIDFPEYLRSLGAFLEQTYGAFDRGIGFVIEGDGFPLGIDQAVPCGLIVNELISNSMKHAFPEGRGGTVRVSLERNAGVVTIVHSDDGVGFPADLDLRNTGSFGMELVTTLVDQLEGDIEVSTGGGTTFTIRFPVPETGKRR